MKNENHYWKLIAESLGADVTGNMKSVNHYLKLIYEELGGEEDGRKPNQFYLQFLLDYYTKDEEE